MSPVRYELGSYIPEDGILHSHRRESLKSYIVQGRLDCLFFRVASMFYSKHRHCFHIAYQGGTNGESFQCDASSILSDEGQLRIQATRPQPQDRIRVVNDIRHSHMGHPHPSSNDTTS
jgi:hypothetical protein